MKSETVLVWQCSSCGCQRSTRPIEPDQDDERPESWAPISGGVAHRCNENPEAELDGKGIYAYHSCELKLLIGEDAELWELLQHSESEDEED